VSVIPNKVRINYLIPFRITGAQINEKITHSTQRRTTNFDGYTVTLFLRRIDRRFILVDGRQQESPSSPLAIQSAYIFDQDLSKIYLLRMC
jgi:hypothetical protein